MSLPPVGVGWSSDHLEQGAFPAPLRPMIPTPRRDFTVKSMSLQTPVQVVATLMELADATGQPSPALDTSCRPLPRWKL